MNKEDNTGLLPLFPLPVVLYPGMNLPLHIFELRYREMIELCMESDAPFGVLLVEGGEMRDIGCSAETTAVVQRYPGGEFDIITSGICCFEVKELIEEKDYLQGRIDYFDDLPVKNPDQERIRWVKLHNLIIKLHYSIIRDKESSQKIQILIDQSGAKSSFVIAQAINLDFRFQQTLIEMRSETKRLKKISEYLSQYWAQKDKKPKGISLFGGNGKARH